MLVGKWSFLIELRGFDDCGKDSKLLSEPEIGCVWWGGRRKEGEIPLEKLGF